MVNVFGVTGPTGIQNANQDALDDHREPAVITTLPNDQAVKLDDRQEAFAANTDEGTTGPFPGRVATGPAEPEFGPTGPTGHYTTDQAGPVVLGPSGTTVVTDRVRVATAHENPVTKSWVEQSDNPAPSSYPSPPF